MENNASQLIRVTPDDFRNLTAPVYGLEGKPATAEVCGKRFTLAHHVYDKLAIVMRCGINVKLSYTDDLINDIQVDDAA